MKKKQLYPSRNKSSGSVMTVLYSARYMLDLIRHELHLWNIAL